MVERERLVELLCSAPLGFKSFDSQYYKSTISKIVDYLLDNGVIVPPCKVGDTVYELQGDGTIQKWFAYGITKYDGQEWAVQVKNNKNKWKYVDRTFGFNRFGKTVFLTRKEAEKALKEVQENDR